MIKKSATKYIDGKGYEKCVLCNTNQARDVPALRETATNRILCISCLSKIAMLN